MTRWWAVAGLAGVVLLAVLLLSRASQRALTGDEPPDRQRASRPVADEPGIASDPSTAAPERVPERELRDRGRRQSTDPSGRQQSTDLSRPEWTPALQPTEEDVDGPAETDAQPMSTGLLLANVALTQGVFLVVLSGGLFLLAVPPGALGLGVASRPALLAGAALGVGLYVANELGAGLADRVGLGHDERLRELLAPESAAGWVVLLVGVLPIIAGFEELLFRGVLVGALATGFPVSPWLLAVGSSVAFGLGHGAQGRAGVLVTGALGFALAAGFVLTESLLAVFVAHYLVNALEFVVHEGLGLDWSG